MVSPGSLQLYRDLGLCRNHVKGEHYKVAMGIGNLQLVTAAYSSHLSFQQKNRRTLRFSNSIYRTAYSIPSRCNVFACQSSSISNLPFILPGMKAAAVALTRPFNTLRHSSLLHNLVPAIGVIVFSTWALEPLLRQIRCVLLHKSENSWRKSSMYNFMASYIQPLLLWTGAILICRGLDPLVLPTAASQAVKQRLLNFVRSLSTVLALAYCLSSVIQQGQKFFEAGEPDESRNMGFQFAGKAVYSAVWVAAVSLFMELLGFSTQKWLTAGGLGTVLLTLAGREIFTNFLSSVMIHATRPFVLNEWIQTKIDGYEVSGTVEHVGWWSPTIIRGEDREAVHIPNHKFTVNVVRNLSQKSHWRIKTHIAISHYDANKINNIVSDMRKVLAKNPQVEHKRLHRRVFLDYVNPENQALTILISCFVKTSHLEEYLCVKEAILLDLLRVISHHRARLATPIRTMQKIYTDRDLENIPFVDSTFNHGGATSNRPLLLIAPPSKVNKDKTQTQNRSDRTPVHQDGKVAQPPADSNAGAASVSASKTKKVQPSDTSRSEKAGETKSQLKERPNAAAASASDSKTSEKSSSNAKALNSESENSPETKLHKNNVGNATQNKPDSSAASSSNINKAGETSSTSPPKSEGEKKTALPPSKARPALEDNMVLGVALDGSKRTLLIEEEEMNSSTMPAAEAKERASCLNGSGPSTVEKEKKDGQIPTSPMGTN